MIRLSFSAASLHRQTRRGEGDHCVKQLKRERESRCTRCEGEREWEEGLWIVISLHPTTHAASPCLSLSLLGHRTPSTVLVRRRVSLSLSISPTEAHKRRERHTQSRNPRSLECNPPSLASHTASLSLPRFSPVELLCSSKSISLLHLSLSCAVAASCCSCDATIDSQEC